jgi:KipI family sensor histidine kinase inhibitor
MTPAEIVHLGDAALLATFGDVIDPALNQRVLVAAAVVRRAMGVGDRWLSAIPAYASLLVEYDPLRLDADAAAAELRVLLAAAETDGASPAADPLPIEIAVRYGGEDGPDLEAVAERCQLTAEQVVEVHTSVIYRAYMLGFAPGFAYLGELPSALEVPRLDTPRRRVPAGSVAIAGRQTAVYPQDTPGGWQLIGRTDRRMWDLGRQPPALITEGSRVRFIARA